MKNIKIETKITGDLHDLMESSIVNKEAQTALAIIREDDCFDKIMDRKEAVKLGLDRLGLISALLEYYYHYRKEQEKE